MIESNIFEAVLMEKFKERWGLLEFRRNFSLNEMVILSVLSPESVFAARWTSPTDAFKQIQSMFHPFPAPIKEPTFFEILRKKLQDTELVKSRGDGVRKEYIATKKGRIQLQFSLRDLARKPQNADEALFLMHAALQWVDLRQQAKRVKKSLPDSFWGFIGLKDETFELLLADINPKGEVLLLKSDVKKTLKERGEVLLSKETEKNFSAAAIKVLSHYQANSAFFKDALEIYRQWFYQRAKAVAESNDQSYLAAFSPLKDQLFAELCGRTIEIIESGQ